MGKEDEAYIRGFSWGGLFFIILLSLFVCVLCFYNATNYGAVLANKDKQLPDTRGSITFYLWLNVIIAVYALYIFILFLYKLAVGNKNPYKDILGGLINEAVSLNNFEEVSKLSDCKAIGFVNAEQCEDFNNKPLKIDKVAYYLENVRYVSDIVNDQVDIHENIYERACEIKDKAIDCIATKLEPLSTKELYKIGGVKGTEDLNKAKKLSEELIEKNVEDIKDLEIPTKPQDFNFIGQTPEAIRKILSDATAAATAAATAESTGSAAAAAAATAKDNAKKKEKEIENYLNKIENKTVKINEFLKWERTGKTKIKK